jgi:hypothetical protein
LRAWQWGYPSSPSLELEFWQLLTSSSLFILGIDWKPFDVQAPDFKTLFANSLAIISRGIPQTMAAFGLKYFLDDLMFFTSIEYPGGFPCTPCAS